MQKKLSFILALLFSAPVLAAPVSSTIPIDGLNIKPGARGIISLAKLYDDVSYELRCKINSTADATVDQYNQILLDIDYGYKKSLYVDDKAASFGVVQKIKSSGSALRTYSVHKGEMLTIRNLDYTDTIVVSNCQAYLQS